MAQRKKKDLQVQESQPAKTPPIPLGANSGGPAPLTGNRAAHLSRQEKGEEKKEKPKRESKMLEFQCRVSDYANDHMPDVKNWHIPRPAAIAAGLMMFGLTLTMNASSIATQAVLNANDQVLLTAMEISPDALASVLNMVDIGE